MRRLRRFLNLPPAPAGVPQGATLPPGAAGEGPPNDGPRFGLSARLFVLTIAFLVITEILIYVPAVATYRLSWLNDRITAAQVAALALDATPGGQVTDALAGRLLTGAGVQAIAVRDATGDRVLAPGRMPDTVAETVDLCEPDWTGSIRAAFRTLLSPAGASIRVIAQGRDGFDRVEVLLDEAPLREAVTEFAIWLLLSSLVIAAGAAGLIFFVLQRVIVRPVRQLAFNITAFADNPERIDRVVARSRRSDEIGYAEKALARMEIALGGELRQKRRLAELGLSVSKINHELRNLLTTAQLLGDRLEGVADPLVQRVAPRLLTTLDRAIRYCEATLAYGRATEREPQRRLVPLAPILAELTDLGGLVPGCPVLVEIRAGDGLRIDVDAEQLLRAMTNLVRNAVQAHAAAGTRDGRVTVEAVREERDGLGRVTIVVADDGPGVPERARAHLFLPFKGSARPGGTGLGLAVAAELVQLNGGVITLDPTETGARFRTVIPDRVARAVAA